MNLQKRLSCSVFSATLIFSACTLTAWSTGETAKVQLPSAEEIKSKRSAVREQLMLPSLAGIRGLAFNVIGFQNPDKAEKQMSDKLKQLSLPVSAFGELKEGSSTVDAMVHVHFIKLDKYAIGEMTVYQWASLLRSPKTNLRVITYRNRVFVPSTGGDQAITELCDQFIADFKKANSKPAKSSK